MFLKLREILPFRGTEHEWILVENGTKKEIDLKGWSIATGWDKLSNHPIREKFKIKPGKTKKLTRKICAFTLNNTKNKIELRNPLGEVVQEIKYNRKKDTIKEDEIYQKKGKKWSWNNSASPISTEIAIAINPIPTPAASAPIISEEELKIQEEQKEIEENVGKFTPTPKEEEKENNGEFSKIKTPQNLALNNPLPKFSVSEGRVLGASDIRQTDRQYFFTPAVEQKHWMEIIWEKTNAFANSFLWKFSAWL